MVEIQEVRQQLLLDSPQMLSLQIIDEVKEELDEHRLAINENTEEIQGNFAFLCELDKKLSLLAERLDELSAIVKGQKTKKSFKISPLSAREKEVFMALYTLGELYPFVSYKQLAKKLSATESVVASFVTNLIEKGVPVLKKYDSNIAYLKLDDVFRQQQAKENLVGVNTLLSYWL